MLSYKLKIKKQLHVNRLETLHEILTEWSSAPARSSEPMVQKKSGVKTPRLRVVFQPSIFKGLTKGLVTIGFP